MGPITLLTDFGWRDGYVGVMHGVILRINPAASIVDLGHGVAPQDVMGAAFQLYLAYPYFAANAIHVVVVDPGVGSERRAMALRTSRGTFVAPDNGVLSYVLARETVREMVQLANPKYWLTPVSSTFHGRDVFAPVAAHLSLGVEAGSLGPPIDDPLRLPIPEPLVDREGQIRGQVMHVDRFGNLITNIAGADLAEDDRLEVTIAGHAIGGQLASYARALDGEALALVGSHGNLEVAVRNGSAAEQLGAQVGALVVVRRGLARHQA